jgi:hypothetical protein
MEINIEKLIEIIVREVVTELLRLGVPVDKKESVAICSETNITEKKQYAVIDMSIYKTPLLTENHLKSLDSAITEIRIPRGTIITQGAKDIIKKRNLILNNN